MEFIKKIKNHLFNPKVGSVIYNINYNLLKNQKRIALVYRESVFLDKKYLDNIKHVNILHQYQMINILIKLDYCIDLYPCNISTPSHLRANCYDIILGFGENYLNLCNINQQALKVLFVTENAPWIVKDKFDQRLNYYKQRHNNIPYTFKRMQFYNDQMFNISDIGIIMNGKYNYNQLKDSFDKSYKISVNALFNQNIENCPQKDYGLNKKNFVWFGSNGLIHKGLDILIDAFKSVPECTLNIYGAPSKEFKAFNLSNNIINHNSINVYTDEFVEEVVKKNVFTLSLSCSEAMMSGVATCMVHGLIPITTIETGFDDFNKGLIFKSYKLNDVIETIKHASCMDNNLLSDISQSTFNYSRNEYSLDRFSKDFETIMIDINSRIL